MKQEMIDPVVVTILDRILVIDCYGTVWEVAA